MNNASHHNHWAARQERGSAFFLHVTALLVRYLPVFLLRPCVWLVVMYFYATSGNARQSIQAYHRRLVQTHPRTVLPRWAGLRHFVAFGEAICDRFAVWQGKIQYQDLKVSDDDNAYADMNAQGSRGAILVCSHLGNMEICRALVSHHAHFRLNVLVHSKHAVKFNRALQQAGADRLQLLEVSELDVGTMMELGQRLEAGEWLAIAADRIPVTGDKTVAVTFLGQQAVLPQGAWLLAALLRTRVYTIFCLKEKTGYHLKLRYMLDAAAWPRARRGQEVSAAAQTFATLLEQECAQYPLQWFNFYDFWGSHEKEKTHILPPQV